MHLLFKQRAEWNRSISERDKGGKLALGMARVAPPHLCTRIHFDSRYSLRSPHVCINNNLPGFFFRNSRDWENMLQRLGKFRLLPLSRPRSLAPAEVTSLLLGELNQIKNHAEDNEILEENAI